MTKRKFVPYKRKLQGKTDYRKRIKLLSSSKPRLVVRRLSRHISLQLVSFNEKGDKVLLTINSLELKKYGWLANKKNLPAAYLSGLLLGIKAKKLAINEAILDTGLHKPTKGSVFYSVLKGALDAGLKINHNENILLTQDRIKGQHIVNYIKQAQGNQFSLYKKDNITDIIDKFDVTKNKILSIKNE